MTQRLTNDVEIRRTLDLLFGPGQLIELRVLVSKKQTDAGYFTDREKLIKAALAYDGKAPQYVVANAIDPRLLARYNNRVERYASATTTDDQVIARRWLPIDFDPDRPAGIPASDAEHAEAHQRAQECRAWLAGYGWSEPAYADSGNGAWLLYRLPDLANSPEWTAKIKRCLAIVSLFYQGTQASGIAVKVDQTIFNAARIVRLFGTGNLKGDGDTASGRTNRASRIVEAPSPMPVLTIEAIERLLAAFPEEKPDPRRNGHALNGAAWDALRVEAFIDQHQLQVAYDSTYENGHKWVLAECPFNAAHTDKSAVIILRGSGMLGFRCHHNGCTGNDWKALRAYLEPEYTQRATATATAPLYRNGTAPESEPPHPAEFTPSSPSVHPTQVNKVNLIHASRLDQIAPTTWLIDGVLAMNKLSQTFAPPGSGKSFTELDKALCVAQQYPVVYVAAEAVEDYHDRVAAWCAHHGKSVGQLYFWPEPVQLRDPQSVDAFLTAVHPIAPAAIFLDPLASCMVGLEESSTGDMTIAVEALNRIRRETGAAVHVVHHTGWADSHERGSSVLRAACRIVMKLSLDDSGLMTLTCEKANNGKPFEARYFRLVEAGPSAVPIPADRTTDRDAPLSARQVDILESLDLAHFRDGATFSQIAEHVNLAKSTVNKALSRLVERGYVCIAGTRTKRYSLTEKGRDELLARLADTVSGASSPSSPIDGELGVNWRVNSELMVNSASESQIADRITEPNSEVVHPHSELGSSPQFTSAAAPECASSPEFTISSPSVHLSEFTSSPAVCSLEHGGSELTNSEQQEPTQADDLDLPNARAAPDARGATIVRVATSAELPPGYRIAQSGTRYLLRHPDGQAGWYTSEQNAIRAAIEADAVLSPPETKAA